MRIKKYDFNYGRRVLLEKTLRGIGTAGVLTPFWPSFVRGADVTKAYPEELLHIEAYTKGKVKVGDLITSDNVDVVRSLVDPITYTQVKTQGRRIRIVATVSDSTLLFPFDFLQATVRNQGKAVLDGEGNIWAGQPGTPWCGGLPFPDPKTAYQAMANLTLSWGRHDLCDYAVRDQTMTPDGAIGYRYDFADVEVNINARVDGQVFGGRKDLLRLNTVWFTAPQDVAGTSFLSVWKYDQRTFPDLYGYLPNFKRVRQFPTNQRFEPLVPGITLFLSDLWGSGDPLATWGNYRIVGRTPFLAPISGNWAGKSHNWEQPTHGGLKGNTFYELKMQLVPEALIIEAEPTGFSRAPVSKKRLWVDARNSQCIVMNTYDRRGDLWKLVQIAAGPYIDGDTALMDRGHPIYAFCSAHIHDIQSNYMSLFLAVKEITMGHLGGYGEGSQAIVDEFLTPQALQHLGSRSA